MLLAWSGFHLERRRRRHVPVLQEPGQIRRDDAIVIGVCLLTIVGGLLVGGGLVWWWVMPGPASSPLPRWALVAVRAGETARRGAVGRGARPRIGRRLTGRMSRTSALH